METPSQTKISCYVGHQQDDLSCKNKTTVKIVEAILNIEFEEMEKQVTYNALANVIAKQTFDRYIDLSSISVRIGLFLLKLVPIWLSTKNNNYIFYFTYILLVNKCFFLRKRFFETYTTILCYIILCCLFILSLL